MNGAPSDYGLWIGLLALLLILGPLFALRPRSGKRVAAPMPDDWQARLARLPHAALLTYAQRERWHRDVADLWPRVTVAGCQGFWVTADVRAVILGYACLLRVNAPEGAPYPRLKTVLVYPQPFLVPQTEPDELGLVSDDPVEQIGESWAHERVVLSWADVEAALMGDPVNVLVHEFAHQLDDESDTATGIPPWGDPERWSRIMQAEYDRLRRHRRPRVLDPYGRESPEEFFGVVMEAYFQRGAELAAHHADLYALLQDTFELDTTAIAWPAQPPFPAATGD
jgi:MtfA peptidase